MQMKLDHYSTSQHGMIYRCGEQYRRRYGLGDKLAPAIVLIRGRAVHTANEANMIAKIDGDSISVDEARDIAAVTFRREVRSSGYIVDGEYAKEGFSAEKAEAHAYDDAVALAALHVERVAPTIKPTAVEVRIEVPPSDSLPVKFVSVLDVIHNEIAPIDTKTKSKAPNAGEADKSEQLSGQSLAFRALKGKSEEFLRLDVLKRTFKARKADYHPQTTTRSPDDLAVFVKRANAALRMIEAEVFLPCPADSWVCDPLWCGYYDSCPYARGRKRPTS
jgi:hypothetical protein